MNKFNDAYESAMQRIQNREEENQKSGEDVDQDTLATMRQEFQKKLNKVNEPKNHRLTCPHCNQTNRYQIKPKPSIGDVDAMYKCVVKSCGGLFRCDQNRDCYKA